MKKILLLSVAVCFASHALKAQKLLNAYRSGTIVLKADTDFGNGTDWNRLYGKLSKDKRPYLFHRADIAFMDDGSLFISNAYGHRVYKLDPAGQLTKTIGRHGKGRSAFATYPSQIVVLDDVYLIVTQYTTGRITVFDVEGNYLRHFQVDYPLYDCVALRDGKIGILGLVPYSGMRTKEHVAILDIQTGEEKPVVHYMRDNTNRYFEIPWPVEEEEEREKRIVRSGQKDAVKLRRTLSRFVGPFRHERMFICRSTDGNLVVGHSRNNEVIQYSPEGIESRRLTIDIDPLPVTEEDKEKLIVSLKNAVEEWGLPDSTLEDVKKSLDRKKDLFPSHTPYYHQLSTDSEGNLLAFEYSNEGDQVFRVYPLAGEGGQPECRTKIDLGEFGAFEGQHLFEFHDGYCYALLRLKRDDGWDMRFLRVDLDGRD